MTAWLFCTSGSALGKAGEHNAMTTATNISISGTLLLGFYNDAEGNIEQATHTAWSDNYASLPTGIKNQLSQVCSNLIAMDIIAYNNTGYLTRESDTLMNKCSGVINAGLTNLTDKTKHTLSNP